jgi:hypothetical protein
MDATPIDFDLARPLAGRQQTMGIDSPPRPTMPALAETWKAVHDAAVTVGAMAGIDQARIIAEIERGLPFGAQHHASEALHSQCQDLADVLLRGITALLMAHVEGGSSQAAARSLWGEFIVARDALIDAPASTTIDGP